MTHPNQHQATSNPPTQPPQPPNTSENDWIEVDEIPPEVLDVVNHILAHLAQSFADVLAPTRAATDEIASLADVLVIGVIVAGDDTLPGIVDETGEYWPDAHQMSFTAEPVEAKPRDRLQDWLDRSGDVLEVDGSGYTRGGPSAARSSPPGHHTTAAQQIRHRDRLVERGWPISEAWADAQRNWPFPDGD